MKKLKGIPSSEGIVIGKCYILDRQKVRVRKFHISEEDIPKETERFNEAVDETEAYLQNIKKMSSSKLEDEHSFIFDVYLMLLKDDMLIGEAIRTIKERHVNAEFALRLISRQLIMQFERSDNEYLRERKTDIEHVVQKILRFMSDVEFDTLDSADGADIVIAHDLTPADTAHISKEKIYAFATDLGSRTSHTSILARSLAIPAVVGLEDITLFAEAGDMLIIDGFEGEVILEPDEETLEFYKEKQARYLEYMNELDKLKDVEVKTIDGEEIKVCANIELNEEISLANDYNAFGIGLYRTEYIYIQHGDVSEEEQFKILKEAVLKNNGKPITIRTFDLGGEKLGQNMPHPNEQNPVMGLRAIRYSMRFKEFFVRQLRAILRAAAHGEVNIMFPMISGMEEYYQCKNIMAEAASQLETEKIDYNADIKVGVMMELPSLAMISDLISAEVDFVSVGTNDLIQYMLGIDRNNEYVAYLYRPAHPSIIQTLDKIIKSAEKFSIGCSVCGEMAGDPKYIPLLLGLGYRHLSMSPSLLLKAKMVIRQLRISDCRELVDNLISSQVAREAEDLLNSFINDRAHEVYFH